MHLAHKWWQFTDDLWSLIFDLLQQLGKIIEPVVWDYSEDIRTLNGEEGKGNEDIEGMEFVLVDGSTSLELNGGSVSLLSSCYLSSHWPLKEYDVWRDGWILRSKHHPRSFSIVSGPWDCIADLWSLSHFRNDMGGVGRELPHRLGIFCLQGTR